MSLYLTLSASGKMHADFMSPDPSTPAKCRRGVTGSPGQVWGLGNVTAYAATATGAHWLAILLALDGLLLGLRGRSLPGPPPTANLPRRNLSSPALLYHFLPQRHVIRKNANDKWVCLFVVSHAAPQSGVQVRSKPHSAAEWRYLLWRGQRPATARFVVSHAAPRSGVNRLVYFSAMVMLSMVSPIAMEFTTSMPALTFPKTV